MNRIVKPWFRFRGVKSSDVGIMMVEQPIIQQAAIAGSKVTIPGMNGFMFTTDETYQPITISQKMAVPDSKDRARVLALLSGYGELEFFYDPGKCYDAYILTGFKRQAIGSRLDGQKFTVTFTCQPFKRLITEEYIDAAVFYGDGDETAYPLVQVIGSGTQIVTVNLKQIEVKLTAGVPLYLDCLHRIAYTENDDGTMNFAGSSVTLLSKEWFELNPSGQINLVSKTDSNMSVRIKPHWRWF